MSLTRVTQIFFLSDENIFLADSLFLTDIPSVGHPVLPEFTGFIFNNLDKFFCLIDENNFLADMIFFWQVSLVSGILCHQCGPVYGALSVACIASYITFTLMVTKWRTKFRCAGVGLHSGSFTFFFFFKLNTFFSAIMLIISVLIFVNSFSMLIILIVLIPTKFRCAGVANNSASFSENKSCKLNHLIVLARIFLGFYFK